MWVERAPRAKYTSNICLAPTGQVNRRKEDEADRFALPDTRWAATGKLSWACKEEKIVAIVRLLMMEIHTGRSVGVKKNFLLDCVSV